MVDLLRSNLPTTDNVLGRTEENTDEIINNIQPQQAQSQPAIPRREPSVSPPPDPTEPTPVGNTPPQPDRPRFSTDPMSRMEMGDFLLEDTPNPIRDTGGLLNFLEDDDREQKIMERRAALGLLDVLEEEEDEGSWFEEAGDFLYYGWEGFQDSLNNTFNLELEVERPDENDLSDVLGFEIGKEGVPIIGGSIATAALSATGVGLPGAALTGARVGKSTAQIYRVLRKAKAGTKLAKTIAPLIPFEIGYGMTKQFSHDLDDPLISDLFKNSDNWSAEEKDRFLTQGFSETETVRRLMRAGEDAVMGLGIGAVTNRIGAYLLKKYTPKKVKEVTKVMTGGSDAELNQEQRLVEWLVREEGFTPEEAVARVSGRGEGTLEEVIHGVNPESNLKEIDDLVKGDAELRKRIYGRNLVETILRSDTDEVITPLQSARIVNEWDRTGILDRKIKELSGSEFSSSLRVAEENAIEALKKAVPADQSRLFRKGEEALRVGMENSALLDGYLQKALTGIGHSGKDIEEAFSKGKGYQFVDDASQLPYVIASGLTNRISARVQNAIKANSFTSKFIPVLPTRDGGFTYSSAKSLLNIQKDTGMDDEAFDGFLQFMRAKKMHNDLVKHGHEAPLSEETLERIIEEGSANPAYTEALPEFSNLMRYLLDYSMATGQIEKRDALAMIDAATNEAGEFVYIPRHTVDPDPEAVVSIRGKKSAYQKLEGTERELKDAFSDVVEQISIVIHRGEENILKSSRYNMIDKASNLVGSPNIGKLAKEMATEVDLDDLVSVHKVAKKDRTLNQQKAQAFAIHKLQNKDKTYDVFFDQGKIRAFEVHDPALQRLVNIAAPTVESLDTVANTFGKVAEKLAKPTRFFTNLITKTPPFAVKAFIRDSVFVEFASPIGTLPKGRAFRGLFNLVFNRKIVDEMRAAGFQGSTKITEVGKRMVDLNRLKAAGAHASEISKAERGNFLSKLAHGTLSTWTDIINNAEMAGRVGEYIVAKKSGMSPELSAFFAMDSAVNFAKTGSSSGWRTFTDMQAFFRPTYLGMAKTAEVIKHNPLKASLYLGSMATFINSSNAINSLYPDWRNKTEEERRLWMYLPNVDSKEFLEWVKNGMEGDPPKRDEEAPWITIPAVHELQVVSGALSRISNMMSGKADNDTGSKLFQDILEGLTPPMSSYLVVPTLFSPGVDLLRNESKFGTPILREAQQVRAFKEDIINPTTGDAAIWLSNVSKYLDNVFGKGDALFTPIQAEYFMKNMLVGGAEYIKNSLDWWARPEHKGDLTATALGDKSRQVNFAKWVAEETAAVFYDSSLAGRGYKSFIYDMQSLANEYRTARRNNTNTFMSTFGNAKVRDFDGEEKLLIAASPFVRSILEGVREYDKMILRTQNNSKLTPEEKLLSIRSYKSAQDMTIERFIKTIERVDPDKDLESWEKLAPTTN